MRRHLTIALALAISCIVSGSALAQQLPTVRSATLIDGRPDVFLPQAGLANLDAGDLIAGSSRYDHDGDGVIFNETRVGFLWTLAMGMQMFDVTDELYYQPHLQIPNAIADDGTVIGTLLFRTTFENLPFRNTAGGSFEFLPLPGAGWIGSAVATSADGRVIVGAVQQGVFGQPPSFAAVWTDTVLQLLPSGTESARALDVSEDGRVVVGSVGPVEPQGVAARWVDGIPDPLRSIGVASIARFTSADGRFAIGTAFTRQGDQILVRWDERGMARRFKPPRGFTRIPELNAINPTATAAVGALSDGTNQAPFLWTRDGGFVVIGELGREDDYDLSRATDVSDDGTSVIGELQARVVFNGDPPQLAYLWRADLGTVTINELMANSGFTDSGFFTANALSGDGLRILSGGLPERTNNDTNSMLIELEP